LVAGGTATVAETTTEPNHPKRHKGRITKKTQGQRFAEKMALQQTFEAGGNQIVYRKAGKT